MGFNSGFKGLSFPSNTEVQFLRRERGLIGLEPREFRRWRGFYVTVLKI